MILSQHLCWVYAPRYLYAANYKSQLLHGRLRRAHSVRRRTRERLGGDGPLTHPQWTRIQLASGPASRWQFACSCALSRQAARSSAPGPLAPGGEVPALSAQLPVFTGSLRPQTRGFSAGKAGVLGDSGLSRPASLGGRECGPLPLSPESRGQREAGRPGCGG
jgi:hypothetical protein